MSLRIYQALLASRLGHIFEQPVTHEEWRSEFGMDSYSPRPDIAIGPFAIGTRRLEHEYNQLAAKHHTLLARLSAFHQQNVRAFGDPSSTISLNGILERNPNARCFMAIEIENRVSRKHLMGGALNASALGRVGVVVGWTPDKVKALVKLRSYLRHLGQYGKPTFDAENLLILAPGQFLTALDSLVPTYDAGP